MHIRTDIGEVLNADLIFSFRVMETGNGEHRLVAFSPVLASPTGPLNASVARGSRDRCETALQKVINALHGRVEFLDIRDLMGQPPDITVAGPGIVGPNGEAFPT